MTIKKILSANKPAVSFEVFPPKKDLPLTPVKRAVAKLAKERPSFISVTYGAGGSANANTAGIAEFVERECATTALAHLTCVTATERDINKQVHALKAAGVQNVLALRGDIPQGVDIAGGKFKYAADLVRYLKKIAPKFCLGGACYPERHPDCPHMVDDIAHLKDKVDAGLDFLTTQMFFDNNDFYRYLSKLRSCGITIPVLAGIMPVANGRQIERICRLSGTYLPSRFKAIVDRFGDNPEAMLDAGVAYATEQIVDLFANGINAVHLYTMNRPEIGARIMKNLRSIIG